MSNPWDRPPFPTRGDEHENSTFNGVGRVLTQWEEIEAELSHLYAFFIGKYFTEEAYDEYFDAAKTSKQRIQSLETKAERYFQSHPNQEVEGSFCKLMKEVGGFSERRHEVAHGVVRPIQHYVSANPNLEKPPPHGLQYCLAPPHYQRNWFDTQRLPRYLYTSKELADLELALFNLGTRVVKFTTQILPQRRA